MNNGFTAVMGFTVRNKLHSKSFIITSVILALLVTLGLNLPYIISLFQSNDSASEVGAITSDITAKLEQFYAAQEEPSIVIRLFPDQGSQEANEKFLRSKVSQGEIKGYVELGQETESGFPSVLYKSTSSMPFGTIDELTTGFQNVKNELVASGLPKETLQRLMAPVDLESVQISATEGGAGSVGEDGKTMGEVGLSTGIVYILVILLFMGIMITGQLIATEITAEKSSRVMEVLITSVAPLQQMFGKIIGMLLVGLSQIVFIVAVMAVNLSLPHNRGAFDDLGIDLSGIDPGILAYALLFYLLGYFLYATIYAAVGSIVSRTEDLGQAVTPITFLSMGGFYLAMAGLATPDASYIAITSYIPFFTPFIMFMRLGLTDPPLWDVWLSVGILCVTIFVMGWISTKIYRTGVLMYGKRPTLKELRKAMKAYKL